MAEIATTDSIAIEVFRGLSDIQSRGSDYFCHRAQCESHRISIQ